MFRYHDGDLIITPRTLNKLKETNMFKLNDDVITPRTLKKLIATDMFGKDWMYKDPSVRGR